MFVSGRGVCVCYMYIWVNDSYIQWIFFGFIRDKTRVEENTYVWVSS